jgi:hypothetical protein
MDRAMCALCIGAEAWREHGGPSEVSNDVLTFLSSVKLVSVCCGDARGC